MEMNGQLQVLPALHLKKKSSEPQPECTGRREEMFVLCSVTGYEFLKTCLARAERDGTREETSIRLSPKRTSPFKSVRSSVQSTAGSRGVRISFSNDGYTTFGGGVRVLATHSIRQFPLHFPSRASPCATTNRTSSTSSIVSPCYCIPLSNICM